MYNTKKAANAKCATGQSNKGTYNIFNPENTPL